MTATNFPLGPDVGVVSTSGSQTVVFTQYVRVILPLDGFVFWVRADLLSQSAEIGALGYNRGYFNEGLLRKKPARQVVVKGSIHIAQSNRQEETETYDVNRVIFTSQEPINEVFNEIDESHLLIGEFMGSKFTFSSRENFYQQAGLWHYVGDAIYPHMESQIIDDAGTLNTRALITSNSLSLWLGLNNNAPFYGFGNTIPLYPSYLTLPNIRPPFGTVHIFPDSTENMTLAPVLGFRLQHSQPTRERVRIVLYGVANDRAMDFVDAVYQYSSDYNFFGIMNYGTMRDEKLPQNELNIIAQKKSIEYEINYYQSSVRDIARQIIGQAIPTFTTVPPYWDGSQPVIVPSLKVDDPPLSAGQAADSFSSVLASWAVGDVRAPARTNQPPP